MGELLLQSAIVDGVNDFGDGIYISKKMHDFMVVVILVRYDYIGAETAQLLIHMMKGVSFIHSVKRCARSPAVTLESTREVSFILRNTL